jgi:hypothetical protein
MKLRILSTLLLIGAPSRVWTDRVRIDQIRSISVGGRQGSRLLAGCQPHPAMPSIIERRSPPTGGSVNLATALHDVGAILTIALGALGLLRPDLVARLVSVTPDDALGRTEIRATYGGLLAGLGLFALASQDEVAFVALGAGWVAAAVTRLIATPIEKAGSRGYRAAAVEAALALSLLFPS